MMVTLTNSRILRDNIAPYAPSTSASNIATLFNKTLEHLLKESGAVLYHFKTVFPLDLFPDEITIDENKVNIVKKKFFLTYNVHSVLISDITDVSVDTGILCSSLTIIDSSNYRFPIVIKIPYLTKKNAFAARNIIQGLIATKRENIALSSLPLSKVKADMSLVGGTRVKDVG